jgi:tRNA-dihydrouridine synthase B
MLAPMEDITGYPLRYICHKYGADITFTEMARIDSLARNNKSTIEKIINLKSIPTIIQIIGSNEEKLNKFLLDFKPEDGFKGFNLNLGCPSPQMINLGFGSALIKRISKVKRIVQIIKNHKYECSIKMRLGLNKNESEKKIYLNLINEVDADFFIVHPRYASQNYSEKANFDVYEECVKTKKRIIANGDISNIKQIDYLKSINVSGAMIGRYAVKDPGIFGRLKGINTPNIEEIRKEFLLVVKKENASLKYKENVIKRINSKNDIDINYKG